ncbi:MAG: type II toxin-antitoxin system PemK/MazF family toxin [Gammaproteobacteria bacterium]|jgi:mRNA interferase MazF|nr:type II toxin-antitoxin system PemK/MazF family toxin [Gammaproteobacteria bacterium]
MAITFHPRPGQILLCDFSNGFKAPEMVKSGRPVVVISKPIEGRSNLVTILCLSTVEPNPVESFHYRIPKNSMPQLGRFQRSDSWVKGDMIYTVGFHRLDLIRLGKRDVGGKRVYFLQKLGRDQMKEIYKCALHGVGLGNLCEHL